MSFSTFKKRVASGVLSAATLASFSLYTPDAHACGCFAPPDPTVPVVQAGERILFAHKNGQVTAHIQIQYQGDAKDFGWLLPLPSVPKLELGTEEIFNELIISTQPRYFLDTVFDGDCGQRFATLATGGTAAASVDSSNKELGGDANSPLVLRESVGPYDAAVLKADNKDAMFKWLTDNHYVVPGGTDQVVGNYIRPGAYFLALKLLSGKAAGDIQPVVLNYQSDFPMIPIILTSVAATPNMGIQVWMLGEGRAIPRNYRHVVINDGQLDWVNQAKNYNDIAIRAISETPERHAFMTEYAGPSVTIDFKNAFPNRFGTEFDLGSQPTAQSFIQYLFAQGYTSASNNRFGFQTLIPSVKAILRANIPMPEGFKDPKYNLTEDNFYSGYSYYSTDKYYADARIGWVPKYSAQIAQDMAHKMFETVVKPIQNAALLISQSSKITRLYSTISPQDMTLDPVFSYNPELADVSRDHRATMTVMCDLGPGKSTNQIPSYLRTEQGWVLNYPNGSSGKPSTDLSQVPSALQIQKLPEEGPAVTEVNNTPMIQDRIIKSSPPTRLGGASCNTTGETALLLTALISAAQVLRRRRSIHLRE